MRREELYLADIVEAADAIRGFLQGVEQSSFLGSDLLRSAVLQKLMIIGEAANKMPKEFRNRHPEVPWRDIVAFRNIAAHAYFSVDWAIVWIAAVKDVPELRQEIAGILVSEYPEQV